MQLGSKTVVGKVRARNEDAILAEEPVFAVADGMGGHQAGEIASHRVLQIIKEHLRKSGSGDPVKRLTSAIQEANAMVFEQAEKNDDFRGMGTTATIAFIEDGGITLGHVGDSRAYLQTPGDFVQLTHDHSLVGEMVREGQLSEDGARTHPARNIITRAIGTSREITPDIIVLRVNSNSKLLLCSDGLTAMLSDSEIASIVEQDKDPQDICDELAASANERGGIDNISIVLIDFNKVEQ